MRLRRLRVGRLPGIDEPFTLESGEAPFQVILGPNEIGKSSVCRAVEALLWPETEVGRPFQAEALFEREGEELRAERDGPQHVFERGGARVAPPALPPAHLSRCFFLGLRDLLIHDAAAGRELADLIRREMAGGYDLRAVEEALAGGIGPLFGKHEKSQLHKAESAVTVAARAHEQLAAREARLDELAQALREAEAAARRKAAVQAARDLVRVRAELAGAEERLAALPEALAQLTGREEEEARQAEADLAGKEREREAAERAGEAARAAAAEARLPAPLERPRLAELEERVRRLEAAEQAAKEAQRARAEKEARLAEAGRAVGGQEAPPDLPHAEAARLIDFAQRAARCRRALEDAEQSRRALEDGEDAEALAQQAELQRRAAEALRRWLRAPDPQAFAAAAGAGAGSRRTLGAAALALLLAGGGLGLLASGALAVAGALAAGAGLGLGVAWLLAGRGPAEGPGEDAARAARVQREDARRSHPSSLQAPSAWDEKAVRERLDELESELARLLGRAEAARRRAEERRALDERLARLGEERSALADERRALAGELGLAEIPDAELADLLRHLQALRQARAEAEAARASERARLEEAQALRRALAAELETHGEPAPGDAAAAQRRVASLRDRSADLDAARQRERDAAERAQQLGAEIARLREGLTKLYARAGLEPGDRPGLARLLDQLEGYRALDRQRSELRGRARQEEERLRRAGEEALATRDEAELAREAQRLEAEAARVGELQQQIAGIRAEVEIARDGRTLENALAARSAAREALRGAREAKLRAEAASFLLGAVRREHEQERMPRVLEGARRLFSHFTHHRYELHVPMDAGAAGSFLAREVASGRHLTPDQLSDGTRAQLLLAARLAFAEEAEAGARLPLFLDEALDHSDPQRFEAIARSLARMAGEGGRQLFYLTNDPADVERLARAAAAEGAPEPAVIDLAAVRGRAASAPAGALALPPRQAPPAPEGRSPEAYAEALHVPPLAPARGADAQHLFHLVWDDLPLLHRLVSNGLREVGTWRTLRRQDAPLAARLQEGSAVAAQLALRAELLDAFCAAWQVGRGVPVDREALEASDGVTDTFLERVLAVSRDLGGDARRLLAALRERRDERLKGFRTSAIEQLEEDLRREGHLPEEEPLGPAALRARVLATPAAARLPEGLAFELCERWWTLTERSQAAGARDEPRNQGRAASSRA